MERALAILIPFLILCTSVRAEPVPWIDYRRAQSGEDFLHVAVDAEGHAVIEVAQPSGPVTHAAGSVELSRYRMNYLRALIAETHCWQWEAGSVPEGAPALRIRVREGDRDLAIARPLADPFPSPAADPKQQAIQAFEGCFRWVTESSLWRAEVLLKAASSGADEAAARMALRARQELDRFPGPYALASQSRFYFWMIPCEHAITSALPVALAQAEHEAKWGEVVELARQYVAAHRDLHRSAVAGLERRLCFFCPGEKEEDYLDAWIQSARAAPNDPGKWTPRPWDWQKPAEDWEETRCALPDEPNVGLRYARPCAWPKVEPPSAADPFPLPSGVTLLGSQCIPGADGREVGRVDLGLLDTVQCGDRLEEIVSGRLPGLHHRIAALQARSDAFHRTDLILREGGENLLRWSLVRSGSRAAWMRMRVRASAFPDLREVLARVCVSLEPQPRSPQPAGEEIREVAVGGLHLEIPAAWKEEMIAGAPAACDYRDYVPTEEVPGRRCRLCVRVIDTSRVSADVPPVWSTYRNPADDSPAIGPVQTGDQGVITQIMTVGRGLVAIESGSLPCAGGKFPVIWFSVADGATLASVALIGTSPGARAGIEWIAGSAR